MKNIPNSNFPKLSNSVTNHTLTKMFIVLLLIGLRLWNQPHFKAPGKFLQNQPSSDQQHWLSTSKMKVKWKGTIWLIITIYLTALTISFDDLSIFYPRSPNQPHVEARAKFLQNQPSPDQQHLLSMSKTRWKELGQFDWSITLYQTVLIISFAESSIFNPRSPNQSHFEAPGKL